MFFNEASVIILFLTYATIFSINLNLKAVPALSHVLLRMHNDISWQFLVTFPFSEQAKKKKKHQEQKIYHTLVF